MRNFVGACLRFILVLCMLCVCEASPFPTSDLEDMANCTFCAPCIQAHSVDRYFGADKFVASFTSSIHFEEQYNRVGEAHNPGPCSSLTVGNFNPGQILGHEDTTAAWGSGIWTASETSHTIAAQKASTAKLRLRGLRSHWSQPVASQAFNDGSLRGRAGGTAVISDFPIANYPGVSDEVAVASSRFNECLVNLGEGVNMYVATLYGPTHAGRYFDPWAILRTICIAAFEHGHAFQGPAIIAGDLNIDIEECPHWQDMVKRGWVDAADFDAKRRGTFPSPTSKGKPASPFC